MKFGIKHILFLLILIPVYTYAGGSMQAQYDYAVKLFNNEQYFDAVTEFKRLLFFDTEKKYEFKANEYIGRSYKMGAKFSDAILYFTLAEINARNNDELYESRIEIIRCNILRRTTARAIALLDTLQNDKRFNDKTGEINYWKGWAYIFDDKWDMAAEAFAKSDSAKELSELCLKVQHDKYSVPFAGIISHFIPGWGQIYTGHYVSGLLSLGWNVLWGYITINSFAANRVFDGLVTGNFLWLRFYNGNLQNSEKFATEENLKITNKAMGYLQSGYQRIKP